MKLNGIPLPAVKRLSLYLRQLELLQAGGQKRVSSRQLGESLGVTDAQVRKDFAYFGQFGHPGVGYQVDPLIQRLRHILGTDKVWNVLVVGAGNLGRALLQYKGFVQKGFRLVAAFDADASKAGQFVGGVPVFPMDEMERMALQFHIRLAIIAVPADSAQAVADRLAAIGIQGVLNFAPIPLPPTPTLAVNAVDLAVQLEQLSFQVNLLDQEQPAQ